MVGTEQALRLTHVLEVRKSDVMHMNTSSSWPERGTSYWPSSYSDNNYISSQSSRAQDASLYPNYRSYLWSRKESKTSSRCKVYIQTVAGLFGGENSNLNFKFFGKAVLRAHVLGNSYEALRIDGQLMKSGRHLYIVKYLYTRIKG